MRRQLAPNEHRPSEQSGIASGALNSARQTGAVLGVAVLGTVIGAAPSVGDGTRLALVVAGVMLLVGAGVVASFIGRSPRQPGTATAK